MVKLYLIPGLATDERLFHKTILPGVEMMVLKWPAFAPGDTMKSYANKFLPQIDSTKPFFLLGVSFGGMCAVEISKIINPKKLILVSSAKGGDELPYFMKMFRFMPLHILFSQAIFIKMSEFIKYVFGRHKTSDRDLLLKMLRECPENYLNGSTECIVNWRSHSSELNGINVVHIHGTDDRVIPFRNIKNAIPVKGGNHFMVLNEADRVNDILNTFI
ncbi:MAG: alpha/beta hydrolase [Bacteroidetes bacterium]|nr:alpha/beta hydrolase [Bacteroidota bacterium]